MFLEFFAWVRDKIRWMVNPPFDAVGYAVAIDASDEWQYAKLMTALVLLGQKGNVGAIRLLKALAAAGTQEEKQSAIDEVKKELGITEETWEQFLKTSL